MENKFTEEEEVFMPASTTQDDEILDETKDENEELAEELSFEEDEDSLDETEETEEPLED